MSEQVDMRTLPNRQKEKLLPPVGTRFVLGGFGWEVCHVHAGQLRFTSRCLGRMVNSEIGQERVRGDMPQSADQKGD